MQIRDLYSVYFALHHNKSKTNYHKGCKIVKKGEVYERTLFTAKNKLFKQEGFVDEAKRFYTDLINLLVEDEKEKLQVFDKNGLYLATKKIGNKPEMLAGIINTAVAVLSLLIYKVIEKARELKEKLFETEPVQPKTDIQPIEPVDRRIHEQASKPAMQIPPRPVMPEDAKAYPKLVKIKQELDKQNAVIFQAEKSEILLKLRGTI